MDSNKCDGFETIDILENATVIYTDGIKESFSALQITNKWVIIGRIMKRDGHEKFLKYGYINKNNIKAIVGGNKKRINTTKP